MRVRNSDSVLDLGCGYGAVGIVASGIAKNVLMTDVNRRALKYAQKNLEYNRINGAEIRYSDLYSHITDKLFDVILVNPPISTGMQVCYSIINGAKKYLSPGGTLQLVARHAKGGERLEAKMKEVFGNVTTLAKSGGFRVYLSEN